jgi:Nitrile hydratase, alpha chain
MEETELGKRGAAYSKVVAKAWSDPAFKSKLMADPKAALSDAGVKVPADLTIKVVENTSKVFHLVIPEPPAVELMGGNTHGNCACGCVSVRG